MSHTAVVPTYVTYRQAAGRSRTAVTDTFIAKVRAHINTERRRYHAIALYGHLTVVTVNLV